MKRNLVLASCLACLPLGSAQSAVIHFDSETQFIDALNALSLDTIQESFESASDFTKGYFENEWLTIKSSTDTQTAYPNQSSYFDTDGSYSLKNSVYESGVLTFDFQKPTLALGFDMRSFEDDYQITTDLNQSFNLNLSNDLNQPLFWGMISDQAFTNLTLTRTSGTDRDFIYLDNMFMSLSPSTVSAVPEPSTYLMMGLGLLMLARLKVWRNA